MKELISSEMTEKVMTMYLSKCWIPVLIYHMMEVLIWINVGIFGIFFTQGTNGLDFPLKAQFESQSYEGNLILLFIC